MAEVFGVVVSALTVAEMASKFGGSIVKLKRLWDEVQDVPNEIAQLVRQLELLRPVLAEMESEFTHQTHKVYHDSAASLSMEYCQQAVAELDALAEDLRSRIDAAKRSRRNITKLKVTFKKEQIRGYQDKIQFALQLLSLSQQTYTISVVKSRFPTSRDLAPQADSAQKTTTTTTPQRPVPPESSLDNSLAKRNASLRARDELATPAMPWQSTSFFGGFVYRTASDPDRPGIEVHQARVQLPGWISKTFWDFQAHRACTGWKVSIKPWTVRNYNDGIFKLCRTGSWADVREALESNEASLQDVDPHGWSLLHFAIFHDRCEIVKGLIEMGLSLYIVDDDNETPLYYMKNQLGDTETSPSVFQYLFDNGELDDDIERCFIHEELPISNVADLIWEIPGILDMVTKRWMGLDSYYRLPLDARFNCLNWWFMDPKVLLDDIHKGGNLKPADFRPVLGFSDGSSLATFTWKYFYELHQSGILDDFPIRTGGEYRTIYDLRDLARWVFAGLSVQDLAQMENTPWRSTGESPVTDGLVEWQLCFLLLRLEPRLPKPRFAQKAFLMWLEDLQAAGIDLAEYGRQELEIYLAHGYLQGQRWFHEPYHWIKTPDPAISGWKLVGFAYGPEPRDWKFTWDLDAWEYAGDFWELVENPPLHIPGGWVDDDDY